MHTKRVFITGGNGFIGKSLINILLNNNCEVIAMVRDKDSLSPRENLQIIENNILNKDELYSALNKIDIVYHIAGVGLRRMKENPTFNLNSTITLVDTINELKQNIKLIFVSSLKATLPGNLEDDLKLFQTNYTDTYGLSKRMSEEYIKKSFKGNYTIVRTPAVYGPNDHNFISLFNLVNKHISIQIKGDMPKFTIIFVDDLSHILLNIFKKNILENKVISVGNEEPIDLNSFILGITNTSNKKVLNLNIPKKLIINLINIYSFILKCFNKQNSILNSRKKDIFDYTWTCNLETEKEYSMLSSKTSLAEGLTKTWDHYKKSKDIHGKK